MAGHGFRLKKKRKTAFFCFAKALAELAQNWLSCPLQPCRETCDLGDWETWVLVLDCIEKSLISKKGKSMEVLF